MLEIRPATEEEQALSWLDGQIALLDIMHRETRIGSDYFQQILPAKRISLFSTNAWRVLARATGQPVTIERLGDGYASEIEMRFAYKGVTITAFDDTCNLTDEEKEQVVG